MRATMQESNREIGIISLRQLLFILQYYKMRNLRKLKDMTFFKEATSRFSYLKKVTSGGQNPLGHLCKH